MLGDALEACDAEMLLFAEELEAEDFVVEAENVGLSPNDAVIELGHTKLKGSVPDQNPLATDAEELLVSLELFAVIEDCERGEKVGQSLKGEPSIQLLP